MNGIAPLTIVQRFVERINAHDVVGLCGLITGDHRHIDSLGVPILGRDACREAWTEFFALVPDYQLRVTHRFTNDSEIALLGAATGSINGDGRARPDSGWTTAVAIRASVRSGLVSEWQVYGDHEALRERMRRR